MPRVRLLLKTNDKGWTKTPNLLIDRLMPVLRDTELRVLLVVLRATTGWNRDGRAVTITYRELMARTGRHTEAISRALGRLERLGAIQLEFPERSVSIKTDRGKPLGGSAVRGHTAYPHPPAARKPNFEENPVRKSKPIYRKK